ncbi:MAG TPA: hypothetical protein ENG95_07455 [Nitrospirae bacterium]|nr:hypothetical protein [Nitrospirota bacterium]HDH51387.1 hypothetical protein [Nitrospirota bacterium]HDO26463.1 hypothetical protein [Nitrospirota bacterium]
MAYVESAVVVYLRAIYFPEGFAFPLKPFADNIIIFELFRELATLIILVSLAVLAARKPVERSAWFLFCFGLWDIFYYVWLKALINWPSSIFEWDILFLIPLPWIAPVIAPVSISLLLITFGVLIIYQGHKGYDLRLTLLTFALALAGTAFILFSFMHDTGAAFHQQTPVAYMYEFLIIGELLYAAAFFMFLRTRREH